MDYHVPLSNIERESALKGFFDTAPMMMGIADVEGTDIRHVTDNRLAASFFGFTPEQLRGRRSSELGIPTDVIREWISYYRRAEALREPVSFEYQHRVARETFTFSVTVSYISRTRHGYSRFSYIVQDVTKMKRADEAILESKRELERRVEERTEALRASEQRFHSLLLQAPAIFSVTRGPDHVFEVFNNEARKGIGGRDCTGLPFREALPELAQSGFVRALDEVYRTGTPIYLSEARADLVQPDGSVVTNFYNVIYQPWRDVDGRIAGIMNVSFNVTEQIRSRKLLEEKELELRTLADSVAQLVWMADDEGNVFWYNRRWYEYTGTTAEDMKDSGWMTVHHPEELPWVIDLWTSSIKKGEPFEMEFPLRAATGHFGWFLTKVVPLKDQSGKVLRWFGTNTSIDEQRQLRKHLEDSVAIRDEFLSIVSHELKTPLTSLSLQTEMTKRAIERGDPKAFSRESVLKLVNQNDKQISRLDRLINDMLDIARMRTGNFAIEKTCFDFFELVRDVVDRYLPHFAHAELRTTFGSSGNAVGFWDKLRIEQVIVNLLTNSIKYGESKPVDIRVSRTHETVRFSISDQGMGIAVENHARIFHRFERAISASEVSGLGLGLFISHEIIVAHGGRIWVKSAPGRGATFSFELPLNLNQS